MTFEAFKDSISQLITLADQAGLPHEVPPLPLPGALAGFSRIGILAALAGLLVFRT